MWGCALFRTVVSRTPRVWRLFWFCGHTGTVVMGEGGGRSNGPATISFADVSLRANTWDRLVIPAPRGPPGSGLVGNGSLHISVKLLRNLFLAFLTFSSQHSHYALVTCCYRKATTFFPSPPPLLFASQGNRPLRNIFLCALFLPMCLLKSLPIFWGSQFFCPLVGNLTKGGGAF